MVLREDGGGVVAIGQASHAWLSGQLARAWGNDRFGAPSPWEEVCLAAEQHDAGMVDWDLEPELNPDTGLPRSFMQMPLAVHLEMWSGAHARLLPQSRYAALLVSMHGSALYARRDLSRMAPPDAEAVRAFLAGQQAVQDELLRGLRADPATAEGAAPEAVRRNQRLIWAWDSFSLALCLGWPPFTIEDVPVGGGSEDLAALALEPAGERRVSVDPWPFAAAGPLAVRCEGRRLEGGCADPRELRAALAAAPWETLRFELASRG